MQKFYKYFTVTVLSLAVFWLGSVLLARNAVEQAVSAQNKQMEDCAVQNVFLIEDNNTRTVHLVYDFNRATVSVVQIQKGYSPPEINVKSRPLGQ